MLRLSTCNEKAERKSLRTHYEGGKLLESEKAMQTSADINPKLHCDHGVSLRSKGAYKALSSDDLKAHISIA